MTRKTTEYYITDSSQDCAVKEFLKTCGYSHHLVTRFKKDPQGLVVDHTPVYIAHHLQAGERLRVTFTEEGFFHNIVLTPLPFSIVCEDENILMINKAAGIPVYLFQGHHGNTLANAVAWYCRQKGGLSAYRTINRLDGDTTDLFIPAKHMFSACTLSYGVRNRNTKREHRVMACGRTVEQGYIRDPIAGVSGSTIEKAIDHEHGESTYARYRWIPYNESLGLFYVNLRLETGCTRQIRVHAKPIGHPLSGDSFYYPDYCRIKRQSPHSYGLSFLHPVTDRSMKFIAEPPQDMACLL